MGEFMQKLHRLFLGLIFCLPFLFVSPLAHANKKDYANTQIKELNEKAKEAEKKGDLQGKLFKRNSKR